jgi:hypothetical protein
MLIWHTFCRENVAVNLKNIAIYSAYIFTKNKIIIVYCKICFIVERGEIYMPVYILYLRWCSSSMAQLERGERGKTHLY